MSRVIHLAVKRKETFGIKEQHLLRPHVNISDKRI